MTISDFLDTFGPLGSLCDGTTGFRYGILDIKKIGKICDTYISWRICWPSYQLVSKPVLSLRSKVI